MNICGWKNLITGQRLCPLGARYRAFYASCRACGPTCEGAFVCEHHAAVERSNPDLIRLTSIATADAAS